jgi:predicted transposase YdaD
LIAEARLMAKRDFVTSVAEAKREGRVEGRVEGRAEGVTEGISQGVMLGQAQIFKNMFGNGADIKTIASMSGFSENEIAKFIQ